MVYMGVEGKVRDGQERNECVKVINKKIHRQYEEADWEKQMAGE